jgi:hypothetical protein
MDDERAHRAPASTTARRPRSWSCCLTGPAVHDRLRSHRRNGSLVLALLIAAGAAGCSRAESPPSPEAAAVRLPGTTLELSIERQPMHPVLAEYHRTAVLRDSARTLVRLPMFDDGGYNRTNLYRQGDSTFVLVDGEGSFTLHPARKELYKDSERRSAAGSRGTFIGAFDVDSSHVWRFIAARERRERPVEFLGGDG